MADKSGGDVTQANFGSQGNLSGQELSGAGSAGPGILGSIGGHGIAEQFGDQAVRQALDQANLGLGGHGGNDNIISNTNITIV